jgi:hypothetical protein
MISFVPAILLLTGCSDAFQAISCTTSRSLVVSGTSQDDDADAGRRQVMKVLVDVGRGEALGYQLITKPKSSVSFSEPPETTRPPLQYSLLSTKTTPPPDFHTPDESRKTYLTPDVLAEGVVSNFPMLLRPGQDVDFWKTPLDYKAKQRSLPTPTQLRQQRSLFTPVDTGSRPRSNEITNGLVGQAEKDYKLIMGLQHTTPMWTKEEEEAAPPQYLDDDMVASTAAGAAVDERRRTPPPLAMPKTSPFHQMKTKPLSTEGPFPVYVNRAQEAQGKHSQTQAPATYTTPTTSYVRPYQQTNNLLFPDRDMEDLMDRTR